MGNEIWLSEEFKDLCEHSKNYSGHENYIDVIKSVNYDQHIILHNIMVLYNDGNPFDCDMTYSKGIFYGTHKVLSEKGEVTINIPSPYYKFDVAPLNSDIVKIDANGALPLEDNSIKSIVIDLPFVIDSPKERKGTSCIIARRFSSYYPPIEMYKSYAHWIKEAFRVLKTEGICVFKTQSVISGGIKHCTPLFSCITAQKIGFAIEDEFILIAKSRLISSKANKQQHARNFHSHFYVFKKYNTTKYDKVNCWKIFNELKQS